MRVRTWLIFCILVLATTQAKPKPKEILEVDQQTVISFTIQEQASNHNQILKLKLEISKRDASLVDAIESSNDLRQELTDIFENFCERFNQTCGDDIETSAYEIDAEYYHLRGQETFKTFVVKYQMDFIFANYQSVGLLLQDFESSIIDNNIVIRGIEWEDFSDQMTLEQVIDEGVERAKKSCESLGMTLFKIKSVEQQYQEEQKQKQPPKKEESQEQDEQEEQEEEEEQPTTQQDQSEKYKFVAVCRSYKPKSKKSSSTKTTEVNSKTKKIKQQ